MNESQFNQLIDETLLAIEDALDNLESDIEYDTVAGILTLEFCNGSKIIINRQIATKQLWLAAKNGGFHFDWVDNQWQETKSATILSKILSANINLQSNAEKAVDIRIEI